MRETVDFQVPFDRELTGPVVGDLLSDPYDLGFPTPQLARWVNTMFASDYSVGETSSGQADGLTSTQRTTRLQALFDKASSLGKELVIPAQSTPFQINFPLYMPASPLTVQFGGQLRNSEAVDDDIASCIMMGNHHPAQYGLYTTFTAGSPVEGAQSVFLDSGANRTNGLAAIGADDLVEVWSVQYYIGSGADSKRPLFDLLAKVISTDATTGEIVLDRPLSQTPQGGAIILNASQPGVFDLNGHPIYACYRPRLIGPGGLVTDGDPFSSRAAILDGEVNLGSVQARSLFYGNLMASTTMRVERGEVTRKIADIAGMSHDSKFSAEKIDFLGPGETGIVAIAFNENSRNCELKIGSLVAGGFAQATLINFSNTVACVADVRFISAPNVSNSLLGFANLSQPVVGDQAQPLTHDNVVRVGEAHADGVNRFIFGSNTGGENKRNRVETGRFFGTVGTYAAEFTGEDNYIGPIVCESGALRLAADVVNLTVDNAYMDAGVSIASGSLAAHNISNLRSSSQALLRAARASVIVSAASSATTPNSVVLTSVVAAGALIAGDTVTLLVSGTVTGTNDTKTIQFTDNTGALLSLVMAAGTTGAFSLQATVSIQSNARYNEVGYIAGAATPVRTARTGLDLNANGRTFSVERWVTNASDSITVDSASIIPARYGFNV